VKRAPQALAYRWITPAEKTCFFSTRFSQCSKLAQSMFL